MSLTRADIKPSSTTIKLKDERTVTIRRLPAMERAEYLGLCSQSSQEAEGKSGLERLKAAVALAGELVARTLVDEAGARLYASGEEVASEMDHELMEEVGGHCATVNHIGKPNDPNA